MEERQRLELWGGVECTIVRIGPHYFEQLDRSGHPARIDELNRFAELGITAIRQPVLWERTAPGTIEEANWSFPDRWLSRLEELRIRPIVGLLHHGSGPSHTSLGDPEFPIKFAAYARSVAERYPWVEDYTPINEPLTTARFSALYGHWYPHQRSDSAFVSALLNQCRGITLAMQEIRRVNSSARLIQTDDLGQTFSTPALSYQADFENERRWLAWDLVCGHVTTHHPLWKFLVNAGAAPAEINWFCENSCSPDVIGVNHYLSSERFLDENITLYPSDTHGTNGKDVYADVVAARARIGGAAGPKRILCEAWERYHIPLAVTEVHNGCTREEQLRWLLEVWNSATELREEGADVRAVTLWSLLGAYDWNSLLTRNSNSYEPGVFDIRAPEPRPTAIAALATQLVNACPPNHPLLEVPGWWKRPERLIYRGGRTRPDLYQHVRPVIITGGQGMLANAFASACALRGIPYRLLTRQDLDIADEASVVTALRSFDSWAVINAAGYVNVDAAEENPETCFRENSIGAAVLATACASHSARLITFSSDLVFDGSKLHPYVESDLPSPLNLYGRSKAEAEDRVLDLLPSSLIVRTSALFSPWDESNFVAKAIRALSNRQLFPAVADWLISPTYVPDLVDATLDLFIDEEQGIWHLANAGAVTWEELAKGAAMRAGLSNDLVVPVNNREVDGGVPRPHYSVLTSEKAWIMPTLESALDRYEHESRRQWRAVEESTAAAD